MYCIALRGDLRRGKVEMKDDRKVILDKVDENITLSTLHFVLHLIVSFFWYPRSFLLGTFS